VLAAYVRACDGDVLEWEERWRRLDSCAEEDDDLPVRAVGASAAAAAGARAGVTVAPAEVHDAERIKAALRAHGEREEKHGAKLVTAGATTMLANGNHHKKHSNGSVYAAKARLASSHAGEHASWDADDAGADGLPSAETAAPASTPPARAQSRQAVMLIALVCAVVIACVVVLIAV
jgi:hypothetical protein